MKHTWPIIGVKNVAARSAWDHALFGQTPRAPNHEGFEQIVAEDGTVLLSLHEWAGQGAGDRNRHPVVLNTKPH